MMTLRSTVIAFAITLAAPVAAFAQAGGMPSATAPSNSEGTPSTSTGVIGTSRVGPSASTGTPIVLNHTRHHRHHHRARHHHTTTSGQ